MKLRLESSCVAFISLTQLYCGMGILHAEEIQSQVYSTTVASGTMGRLSTTDLVLLLSILPYRMCLHLARNCHQSSALALICCAKPPEMTFFWFSFLSLRARSNASHIIYPHSFHSSHDSSLLTPFGLIPVLCLLYSPAREAFLCRCQACSLISNLRWEPVIFGRCRNSAASFLFLVS